MEREPTQRELKTYDEVLPLLSITFGVSSEAAAHFITQTLGCAPNGEWELLPTRDSNVFTLRRFTSSGSEGEYKIKKGAFKELNKATGEMEKRSLIELVERVHLPNVTVYSAAGTNNNGHELPSSSPERSVPPRRK